MAGKARHLQVVHTQTCIFNSEGSLLWFGRKKRTTATEQRVYFYDNALNLQPSDVVAISLRGYSSEHLNSAGITPNYFSGLPRTVWQKLQVLHDFEDTAARARHSVGKVYNPKNLHQLCKC